VAGRSRASEFLHTCRCLGTKAGPGTQILNLGPKRGPPQIWVPGLGPCLGSFACLSESRNKLRNASNRRFEYAGIYIYIYTYIHMHVYNIYIYIHMHVYIYIYIYK